MPPKQKSGRSAKAKAKVAKAETAITARHHGRAADQLDLRIAQLPKNQITCSQRAIFETANLLDWHYPGRLLITLLSIACNSTCFIARVVWYVNLTQAWHLKSLLQIIDGWSNFITATTDLPLVSAGVSTEVGVSLTLILQSSVLMRFCPYYHVTIFSFE